MHFHVPFRAELLFRIHVDGYLNAGHLGELVDAVLDQGNPRMVVRDNREMGAGFAVPGELFLTFFVSRSRGRVLTAAGLTAVGLAAGGEGPNRQ